MKKRIRMKFCAAFTLLVWFVLWTAAVHRFDVQAIGPNGSLVGFAAWNGAFHRLTGVHMALYTVTDWLGLVPLAVALGFALLGLAQLVQRKSLRKVDPSLFVLGGFYLAVMAAYLFFEMYVVNYRPVLIEGRLEVSYPSSTTLLVLCVMPTAMMQLKSRLPDTAGRRVLLGVLAAFAVFMTVGRLISGVHWLTDIAGGIFLSAGLVLLYDAVVSLLYAGLK